jgi:hypothetical protein
MHPMPALCLRAVTAVAFTLSLAAVAEMPGAARAQTTPPSDVPLVDLVDLLAIDRELIAIRSVGQLAIRLQIGEQLLWRGNRGKLAVALTDRRVLAAASRSAAWQELGLRREEQLPDFALLGDRVGLILTDERVIGFNAEAGNFAEYDLGVREVVLHHRVGANTAVVVTDRNAVALSAFAGGFFRAKLGLRERIEAVEAIANLATVTTDRRLLIFRAATGAWSEKKLELR